MSGGELPTHATAFGTDADGHRHHYSHVTNTVYLSTGTQYDLAETPFSGLGEWCEHVQGVCGWQECRYYEDFSGAIEETFEDLTQHSRGVGD